MNDGLTIRVVDPDEDYLGIEVVACNGRFAGTTFIYATLHNLSDFADKVTGFPVSPHDERCYEFGSRDPRIAGGFASIQFRCWDSAGHAEAKIRISGDETLDEPESLVLRLYFEAGALDRFLADVRLVEADRAGEAVLGLS